MRHRRSATAPMLLLVGALLVGACALPGAKGPLPKVAAPDETAQLRWLDRVTWGANASSAKELSQAGLPGWLRDQLHPKPAALPPEAQARIDAMTISRTPVEQIVASLGAERRAMNDMADEAQKQEARKTYQQDLTRLTREAQQRFVLRAVYSPNQLEEQMTWFWMNHFNISVRKANLRALVADYEQAAIRPHALGKFRDLLGATLHHPAMLLYLDNAQNAANRVNENYARELMELHTLGVDGGYTQADVQELARVLTGVGIRLRPDAPAPVIRPALRGDYVRQGLFEFNPNRHDYGPKTLLGQPMTKQGLAEVDEALDRLARAPATARFISRKLAVYFVADDPPPELVARMADTFRRTDGDIAATLQTMFESPEFTASLGRKFRDPAHYVIAGVRLASDGRVISNVNPVLFWIARMGEPLYAHETPDGYPLTQDAWASAGQMNTRFEVARAIGTNGAVLFRRDDEAADAQPVAMPRLADAPTVRVAMLSLSADTREALAQAKSPQDWNTFLLASPEWMHR